MKKHSKTDMNAKAHSKYTLSASLLQMDMAIFFAFFPVIFRRGVVL